MAAILGFMPLLDLRLSIPIKSGRAAKVVPNPATKPTTSDLRKRGSNRLSVSCMPNSSQPARMIRQKDKQNNKSFIGDTKFVSVFRDPDPDAHLEDVIAPRLQVRDQARFVQFVTRSIIDHPCTRSVNCQGKLARSRSSISMISTIPSSRE